MTGTPLRGWGQVAGEAAAFLHGQQLRRGPSQEELADRLGMTQGSVSNFLNSRNPNWKIATMVRLATALGYDVEITFRPKARPRETSGGDDGA